MFDPFGVARSCLMVRSVGVVTAIQFHAFGVTMIVVVSGGVATGYCIRRARRRYAYFRARYSRAFSVSGRGSPAPAKSINFEK
jgi:hypothetical protein